MLVKMSALLTNLIPVSSTCISNLPSDSTLSSPVGLDNFSFGAKGIGGTPFHASVVILWDGQLPDNLNDGTEMRSYGHMILTRYYTVT